jgi:CheY-like chemotaxis protein
VKTILVIEDEADLALYLKAVLEDSGYEVVTSDSAGQALKVLGKQTVDLITLDLTLPDRSGGDLFVEIRTGQATAAVPIVIVSGLDLDGQEFQDLLAHLQKKTGGAPEACLEKPVNPAALAKTVSGLIGS